MKKVRAKKHLGQHFLTDLDIAQRIVESIDSNAPKTVLEIGPGMGVLTQFLLKKPDYNLHTIELDKESAIYLQNKYEELSERIISADFLKFDISQYFNSPITIIGNFPYNISSQILFKIIDNRNLVLEMVGMFQKEVAERVASAPGSKTYGILSVLLQAYYNVDYLFTVNPNVFNPPPKVQSAVIRVYRNKTDKLPCNEKLFKQIVKASFNQRRKTLSNSLKSILLNLKPQDAVFKMRPEQLGVQGFVELTLLVEKLISENNNN